MILSEQAPTADERFTDSHLQASVRHGIERGQRIEHVVDLWFIAVLRLIAQQSVEKDSVTSTFRQLAV